MNFRKPQALEGSLHFVFVLKLILKGPVLLPLTWRQLSPPDEGPTLGVLVSCFLVLTWLPVVTSLIGLSGDPGWALLCPRV